MKSAIRLLIGVDIWAILLAFSGPDKSKATISFAGKSLRSLKADMIISSSGRKILPVKMDQSTR